MDIFLTDTSGVIGRALHSFLSPQHRMRSLEILPGAELCLDGGDERAFVPAFRGCEAVIHLAHAMPKAVTYIRIGSINLADSPLAPAPDLEGLAWLTLKGRQMRLACSWMSQRDLGRLVQSILQAQQQFAIVYGVSDNPGRFWDLEPGRAFLNFWPEDGAQSDD